MTRLLSIIFPQNPIWICKNKSFILISELNIPKKSEIKRQGIYQRNLHGTDEGGPIIWKNACDINGRTQRLKIVISK